MWQAQVGADAGAIGRPLDPPPQPGVGERHLPLAGLLLAIGGIWIGIPLLDVATGAAPPLPDLGTTGVAILLALGAAQALWGLDLLLRRRTLSIERNALHVSVRGLLGVRRWSEPLANYRGLRHHRQRVRHRYGWRIEHRLQLAHPDPAREIELIRARGEPEIAAARRQWSTWLRLPIASAQEATPRRAADEPRRRTIEPSGVATV